jgi:N-acyl-L-homoserine lactone synthetase
MLAALMQYVIEEHATTINVVLNTHFLASLLRWDWAVWPLGLPDQHDGDWLVACQIPATPAAVTGVRVGHGLPRKAALVRRGPQRKLMPHYIEEPRHARAS